MILLLSVHVETSRVVHFHPNHISSSDVWTPLFKYNKICDPHPIRLMASFQAFQDVFWSHYKVSALSTSVDVFDDVILEDVKFYGIFSFATQHILEQLRELASTRSPSFLVVQKSPSSVVAHSVYPVRTWFIMLLN